MTNAVDLPTVTYYQVLGMVHSQPNPLLVQLLYTLYITFCFLAVKMQKTWLPSQGKPNFFSANLSLLLSSLAMEAKKKNLKC